MKLKPGMDPDRAEIESARVRRLFASPRRRDAGAGNDGDFIVREVSRRMAERLDYIRLDPKRVLDAGGGSGADLPALRRRFPLARIHSLDFALPRLAEGRTAYLAGYAAGLSFRERLGHSVNQAFERALGHGLKSHEIDWVCADFAALPYAPRVFDLIWSNLALHWHDSPHRVFPEWARVLDVGGLVLFSAFGPHTLKEVSQAFAAIGRESVLPFTDMHDYGDMLVEAGFATPVVDTERLTLTYADTAALWRDVRALGGNALTRRGHGLLGRRRGQRIDAALQAYRTSDGRYPLSFEIIYGHAWKAQPKIASDGRAIVRFDPSAARASTPRRPPR